jgi:hypothetical protein
MRLVGAQLDEIGCRRAVPAAGRVPKTSLSWTGLAARIAARYTPRDGTYDTVGRCRAGCI